jgi:hypothetical protein
VRGIYFPHVWEQEDYQWARRIREYNLLRTEVHIDKDLYYYDFRTDKPPYSRIRVRRQN